MQKTGIALQETVDSKSVAVQVQVEVWISLNSEFKKYITLPDCLDDVFDWMRSNRLQLNTSKTEILWCSTSRRHHLLPTTAVRVGADYVTPSSAVRDLGIMIDSDVSMRSHVSRTVSGCFATLTTDPWYPTIRIRLCLHVASRVAHHAASALWQRHHGWPCFSGCRQ